LKEQVRAISKRDADAKYGAGVKRVEVELIFPGNPDGPTTFVLEMAPLDLMPHSVYTFLEMVSSGLLDGCSFILNALHVLKAAPLPYDGTSASDKARDFLDSGLESVAFREYSPEFPHRQYTVGFAADGSPSFYINTEDNTEIHVGDPCFAKIVSGFDTIKRLEGSPTRNGIWFEHRIGIKRATVL
jgi:cyclophilin family peptidyl-prolyl cis-trans isomerase